MKWNFNQSQYLPSQYLFPCPTRSSASCLAVCSQSSDLALKWHRESSWQHLRLSPSSLSLGFIWGGGEVATLLSLDSVSNVDAAKKNLRQHEQRCLSARTFWIYSATLQARGSFKIASCPWGHAQLTSSERDTLKHSCKNRTLSNNFLFASKQQTVLSILGN